LDEAVNAIEKAVTDQGLSVEEYDSILKVAQNDPRGSRQNSSAHPPLGPIVARLIAPGTPPGGPQSAIEGPHQAGTVANVDPLILSPAVERGFFFGA
jgi:Domain of unknown function (DUF4168)